MKGIAIEIKQRDRQTDRQTNNWATSKAVVYGARFEWHFRFLDLSCSLR